MDQRLCVKESILPSPVYLIPRAILSLLLVVLIGLAFSAPLQGRAQADVSGDATGEDILVGEVKGKPAEKEKETGVGGGGPGSRAEGGKAASPPPFVDHWTEASPEKACGTSGAIGCQTVYATCDFLGDVVSSSPYAGDYSVAPTTQTGTRVHNTGSNEALGSRCYAAGVSSGGGGVSPAAQPIVIVVTQADFAKLPVEAPTAHAGPPDGWVPVNLDVVMYANDSESQTLTTDILGAQVRVQATPVSYSWELGDGNVITTDDPGRPYPHKDVTGSYVYEGWYDIILTTTFAGQFSVNGGAWQTIDGTIDVTSDPVPIFSKSLESRLVDGDRPVDENGDPWIPKRTPETEGPNDPQARKRDS